MNQQSLPTTKKLKQGWTSRSWTSGHTELSSSLMCWKPPTLDQLTQKRLPLFDLSFWVCSQKNTCICFTSFRSRQYWPLTFWVVFWQLLTQSSQIISCFSRAFICKWHYLLQFSHIPQQQLFKKCANFLLLLLWYNTTSLFLSNFLGAYLYVRLPKHIAFTTKYS